MVRLSYQDVDGIYSEIKSTASGRQACTIMIMVANEVDAMAAARMLMQLLRTDNIAYVMRPVANIKNVQQVYETSITSDIKSIILINCGAIYNIPKLFGMEQGGDQRIYIMDNHRPFHLANIYSRYNVVVFDDVADIGQDDMDLPSDGTDLSGNNKSSSEDSLSEEVSIDDDDEEEDDDDELGSNPDDDVEEEAEMDDNELPAVKRTNSSAADEDKEEVDADDEDSDDDDEASVDSSKAVDEVDGDIKDGSQHDDDADDETSESGDDDVDDQPQDQPDEDTPVEESLSGSKRGLVDQPVDEDEEAAGRVKGKRRKVLEQHHNPEKIRRRKLHEYYTKNATYTAPTALMMLNLSYGRHGIQLPIDQLWQVILGVTDSYLRNHITEIQYHTYVKYLKEELADHISSGSERSRYMVSDGDTEAMINGAETGNIKECLEYRFFLYRHWSLFDAMYHSPYIASKMLVWQASGTDKLQELLAKIGMPLVQSKQSYNFIPPELQTLFRQEITELGSSPEYNLSNPDVMYRSFYRYNQFKNPIAASDVVLAATALLERAYNCSSSSSAVSSSNVSTPNHMSGALSTTPSTGTTTGTEDNDGDNMSASRLEAFNQAYDCLGMKSSDLLKRGITYAIDIQKIIVRNAAIILEGDDLIIRLNKLYYCKIDSSHSNPTGRSSTSASSISNTNDIVEIDEPFTRPQVLTRLGQFIMDVKRSIPSRHGGWIGSSLLPLIMLSYKKSTNTYLVIGISPLQSTIVQQDMKEQQQSRLQILTNFKQLFRIAANECGARFWNDSFDTNVVEVHNDNFIDFLGELNDLMHKASAPVK